MDLERKNFLVRLGLVRGRISRPSFRKMSSRFKVQDLVSQTTDTVIYRALDTDGTSVCLVRLRLDPEAVAALRKPGVFEAAAARLKTVQHPFLRKVIDVGQDEVDGYPWVISRWLNEKSLSDRKVTDQEIGSLGEQCCQLMDDLGDLADVVNFDPKQVLTARVEDGLLGGVFTIDYLDWFRDWAARYPPGTSGNAPKEIRRLLEGMVARQLQPPKKEVERPAIPMVDERSPALTSYQLPEGRPWGVILTWLSLLAVVGVIFFLTWQGMKRMEENPRSGSTPMER